MSNSTAQRRITAHPRSSAFIRGLILLLFVAVSGCQREENLPAKYGNGTDADFERSVNGYTVLADMFAKAGHTISTHEDFTPALADAADTIVYAPDDFDAPEPETIKWVDDWLKAKPDRTFIYIGRDFDAAPIYWRKILTDAPADQREAISDRLQAAELKARFDRPSASTKTNCEWFSFDYTPSLRTPKKLSGDWGKGIDVSKTEIELRGRMDLNDRYNVLLASDDDDIAAKRTILTNADPNDDSLSDEAPQSQFIAVTNGSFLVNLQLVNHEHRKLAGKLIAEVKKPGRVVFMDSSYSSVRNSQSDDSDAASMLDVFGVWPLSVILVHAAVLLAVFCFARWPLFGPPRDPPSAPAADFGRHVDALAEGLQRTGDASYARERWQYYINNTKATSVSKWPRKA